MNAEPQTAKRKFPRASALVVVRELLADLRPSCEKVIVAGSLRRKKREVGDIEFLYIPRIIEVPDPEDFFGKMMKVNAVDRVLANWLEEGTLAKRVGAKGGKSWGAANKFAVHSASQIPVDFFSTDSLRWFNMLVCRTGGAATNVAICSAAQERGWKWHPYSAVFHRGGPLTGREYEEREMRSERDVFAFVGLPYREPEDRD